MWLTCGSKQLEASFRPAHYCSIQRKNLWQCLKKCRCFKVVHMIVIFILNKRCSYLIHWGMNNISFIDVLSTCTYTVRLGLTAFTVWYFNKNKFEVIDLLQIF